MIHENFSFLREQDLGETAIKVLEKEIDGRAFLKITGEKLRSVGLGLGTAVSDLAKECKEKRLRPFSS